MIESQSPVLGEVLCVTDGEDEQLECPIKATIQLPSSMLAIWLSGKGFTCKRDEDRTL